MQAGSSGLQLSLCVPQRSLEKESLYQLQVQDEQCPEDYGLRALASLPPTWPGRVHTFTELVPERG